jgi:hypothetical protein
VNPPRVKPKRPGLGTSATTTLRSQCPARSRRPVLGCPGGERSSFGFGLGCMDRAGGVGLGRAGRLPSCRRHLPSCTFSRSIVNLFKPRLSSGGLGNARSELLRICPSNRSAGRNSTSRRPRRSRQTVCVGTRRWDGTPQSTGGDGRGADLSIGGRRFRSPQVTSGRLEPGLGIACLRRGRSGPRAHRPGDETSLPCPPVQEPRTSPYGYPTPTVVRLDSDRHVTSLLKTGHR